MIDVLRLDTPSLGDRSYLATDGEVAVVVDPQRDIDRLLDLAAEYGVRIAGVAETHLHNDYVSGGLALARETGAAYLINADDEVAFEREGVRDGDFLAFGRMRLGVLATPGHTFTHLAYTFEEEDDGGPVGVFTGGSLLFGATGRSDLLGPQHTRRLAAAQHASAHRLAAELAPEVAVFPTHGFGSFCTAGRASSCASTIGRELAANPVLTDTEEDWLADVLAGLGPYPAYYARMAPANAAGPGRVDLSPPREADPVELRRRIAAGEWVVDVRTRRLFAAGHLPGSANIGLDGSLPTYLGWLLPAGVPVTVLGSDWDAVASAQRELARIGIDRPVAAAVGRPARWCAAGAPATIRRVTFADLAAAALAEGMPFVLDVRRAEERARGAVAGSRSVPLHEVPGRLGEIPADRPVWVYCAGGYRASVAASLLARAGHQVVLVDDDLRGAVAAGLTME
jgi:glyoxylase-like metal-dependent hydrolase (beta-lactamase superfamily II)/rhodanese-related sulfurtransferase